jgi:hypothetical protein
MPLPRISQDQSWHSKGRAPSWAAAVVNIRFIKTDSSLLAEKKYNLGASIANFDWPDDGRWQMSLSDMSGIEEMRDYDVEIEVITPSNARSDSATLEAQGMGLDF